MGHVLSQEAMRNAYNAELQKPRVTDKYGNTGVDVKIKINSKGTRRDVVIGNQPDPHRF
jgi:hypothetical protein